MGSKWCSKCHTPIQDGKAIRAELHIVMLENETYTPLPEEKVTYVWYCLKCMSCVRGQ